MVYVVVSNTFDICGSKPKLSDAQAFEDLKCQRIKALNYIPIGISGLGM